MHQRLFTCAIRHESPLQRASIRRGYGIALALGAFLTLVVAPRQAVAQALTAAVSSPNNIKIKLDPIVNLGAGLIPIDAATIAGDSKLYVATYLSNSASVRVVDPVTKTVSPTPFLTFSGTGVPISGQGLQGIAFSPNFNDSTQPGYRKFYTFQVETGPASPSTNVLFRHPEVSSPALVGVLREWTANAAGTAIDTSVNSRVVFNYGTPGGHMGGGMRFGPDGFLYLATGDGGGNGDGGSTTSTGDGFTGRDVNPGTTQDVPGISNGQDFTNALGKVLRIDPYTTNANGTPRATPADATAKVFGGSTRYFIPNSNPFVGNTQNIFFTPIGPAANQTPVPPLPELYAFGFRNPWKLSFDKNAVPGDSPYVADVGSRVREEISRVEAGNNYGWPYREGDVQSGAANNRPLTSGNLPFLKQTSPGVFAQFDLDPTLSNPTQMSAPIVRLGTHSGSANPLIFADRPGNDIGSDGLYGYQYGDGNTVTGGYVYRGAGIPELQGMYVMGVYQFLITDTTRDPATTPATSGGTRLYYFDPTEAATYKTVRTFNLLEGFGINTTRVPGTFNAEGDLLSISQGDDGELYAMFLNGDIKKIVGPPLGDFDRDFDVDMDDLNDPVKGWKARYGVGLDGNDFVDWQRNLGVDQSAAASAGAVPEPGAAALLLVAIVLAAPRGRRARCG